MEKKMYEEMKKNKLKKKDKRNVFKKLWDYIKKVNKKIWLSIGIAILVIGLLVVYLINKPKVYKTDNIINWSVSVDKDFDVNVIEEKLLDEIEVKTDEGYFAVIGQKFYGADKEEYLETQESILLKQDGKKLKTKKIGKYKFNGVRYVKDDKKHVMYFTVVKDRILKIEITYTGKDNIDSKLDKMLNSVNVKIK